MSIVSLVVRLVDQVSGVAPKIVDSVKGIGGAAAVAGQSANKLAGIGSRIAGISAGVAGLGVVAARFGRSLGGSMRDFAEFEDMLVGMSRTGEMTDAQFASMRDTILKLAPQLGEMPDQVGKVAEKLIAAGITPDRAENMLAPIGRVAVATRSEIEHITAAAQAMFQNLNVMPDKLESTFDKVWLAAKRGNFELKDMAQFLPKLASTAASQGMTGENAAVELAAAAQIVREGAGSPGQAATNLTDLIAKSAVPQTVRRFQKVGVDIKKEIADGLAKGRSPLETIILKSREALANNKGLNVGDLFSDQQAQRALAKLIEKYEEFIKIRTEAMDAAGTIAADYAAMDKTLLAKMKVLDAEIDARRKKWAAAAAPWEYWKTDKLTGFNKWLGDLAEKFSTLSTGVAGFSLALSDILSITGKLSSSLLGIASTLVIGKFLGIGRAVMGLIRLFPKLPGILTGLHIGLSNGFLNKIGELGPAMMIGLAALAPFLRRGLSLLFRTLIGPAGWALMFADLAWTSRESIMKMFNGLWDSIKSAWIGITDKFSSLGLGETLGTLAAADNGAAMEQGGRTMMSKFWEGLKSIGAKLLSWASSFAGSLKSLFSFSVSPTLSLPNGAPLAATPQSYGGGKLAPAPALQRQANMTFNNSFNISGSDNPDAVAQRIVTALNRQRQSGLYDGALA